MKCPLQPLDPITNMGRQDCLESNCAWWIAGERRPGGCCVPRLTHYAAGILAGETALTDALVRAAQALLVASGANKERR